MKHALTHRALITIHIAVLLAVGGWLLAPGAALAGDNQATGDVAGVPADLGDSQVFTLNSVTLALVKTAFLTDGTQLASGTTVPRGTLVQFMVYVDDSTSVALADVNVVDTLDPLAFTYVAGTIKVDSSQASGATEAQIYAAVNAAAAVTDLVSGGDVAGISGTTISAGNGAGNAALTVPANSVWAMLFTAKMQ